MAELVRRLDDVTDPWARLHVCKLLTYIDVDRRQIDEVAAFIRDCIHSERPFLRAWATDALYRLSLSHPALEGEASKALRTALQDPAASVRARAHRLLSGN